MRPIKFRAWDSTCKCMQTEEGSDRKFSMKSFEILQAYDNVMQFTGLFDKNGKEIWEGDVCKLGHDTAKYLVSYYNGSFVFSGPLGTMLLEHHRISEVLGNVWENPELLKEST